MSQADHSDQQDTSHRENSDDRTDFERLLRLVAHGFEGNAEKNLPRLQPFVPSFRTCRHVLDIGCGEGLMLELLRDAGTKASGIDIDPDRVAAANAKGLEATTAEAHAYLRDKPGEFDGSSSATLSSTLMDSMDCACCIYAAKPSSRVG